MQLTNLRLAIAGLIAGALLVGATAIVNHKQNNPQSNGTFSVPGYSGPLYDSQGRFVGYSQPADAASAAPSQPLNEYGEPASANSPQPAYQTRQVPTSSRYSQPAPSHQAAQHHRSTGKSVAIVAGSAGVGSAIGAIAGGGKGAAIGALSGGGAGFVYDRLTHNK